MFKLNRVHKLRNRSFRQGAMLTLFAQVQIAGGRAHRLIARDGKFIRTPSAQEHLAKQLIMEHR